MSILKLLQLVWLMNSVGAFNTVALSSRPILNPFQIDLLAKPPTKPAQPKFSSGSISGGKCGINLNHQPDNRLKMVLDDHVQACQHWNVVDGLVKSGWFHFGAPSFKIVLV